jgi:hypothetical protein
LIKYFSELLLNMTTYNPFGLTLQELRELMANRGIEGVQKVGILWLTEAWRECRR